MLLSPLAGDVPTWAIVKSGLPIAYVGLLWSAPFVALVFRARNTQSLRELSVYQVVCVAVLLILALCAFGVMLIFPLVLALGVPYFIGPALLWRAARLRSKDLRERSLVQF